MNQAMEEEMKSRPVDAVKAAEFVLDAVTTSLAPNPGARIRAWFQSWIEAIRR